MIAPTPIPGDRGRLPPGPSPDVSPEEERVAGPPGSDGAPVAPGGTVTGAGAGAGAGNAASGAAVEPVSPRPDAARAAWDRHRGGDIGAIFSGEYEARPRPSATAAAGPAPQNGWPCPGAPNGRVLPLDLTKIEEDELLRPRGKAALYALGDGPGSFRADREPLILIHGIRGDPKDMQAIVDRRRLQGVVEKFKGNDRYQLYVLAYDDFGRRTSLNGKDLAEELRTLESSYLEGAGDRARARATGRAGDGAERPDVTIVGHSLGGIVGRRALNDLSAGREGGIDRFGNVKFMAIDTPWHGYGGPSDRGVEGFFMGVASVFMPNGLEDMRAESNMFRGDPDAKDDAARAGLLNVVLPENVSVDLVFAEEGDQVHDYTEGKLAPLADNLVDYYTHETPIRGDRQLVNFWRALISADRYFAFQDEMRGLAGEGRLDAAAVRAGLARHFPRFSGDHTGIIHERGQGLRSFLDYLDERLNREGRLSTPRAQLHDGAVGE